MIGFIALGIIVRNAMLLVDFICHTHTRRGAIRLRPAPACDVVLVLNQIADARFLLG